MTLRRATVGAVVSLSVLIVISTVIVLTLEDGWGRRDREEIVVPSPESMTAESYRQTTLDLFDEYRSMIDDGVLVRSDFDRSFTPDNTSAWKWLQDVEALIENGERIQIPDTCFNLPTPDIVCGPSLIELAKGLHYSPWGEYGKTFRRFEMAAELYGR